MNLCCFKYKMERVNYYVVSAFLLITLVCAVQCHYRDGMILSSIIGNCTGSEKNITIKPNDLKHLTFIVFGRNQTKKKYYYHEMDKLAEDPNIDFKNKTMLFITGYLGSPYFFTFAMIGAEYKKLDYNVIALDVNHFTTVKYSKSIRYMRAAGKKAAEMLYKLTMLGLDPKNFEMLGLSLGGQTMSFVAKEFRQLTKQNVPKLIGMDPAGPCFEDVEPEMKLHPSDGDFVVVIYTNVEGMGTKDLAGHVNFFINGGDFQPGDLWWYPCMNLCSHVRSYNLWIAALRFPDKFIGMKCDSVAQARAKKCYDRIPLETNVLGPETDRNNPGIFYVSTSYMYPYYLAEKGLSKEYRFDRNAIGAMNLMDVIKLWISK